MKISELRKLPLEVGKVYTFKKIQSAGQGNDIERITMRAKMIKEYPHVILFDINGFPKCFTRWEVVKMLMGEAMG